MSGKFRLTPLGAHQLKSQKGVTIIEILVTVLVLTIILLLIIPNFIQFMNRPDIVAARASLADGYTTLRTTWTTDRTFSANLPLIGFYVDGVKTTGQPPCPESYDKWGQRNYRIGFSNGFGTADPNQNLPSTPITCGSGLQNGVSEYHEVPIKAPDKDTLADWGETTEFWVAKKHCFVLGAVVFLRFAGSPFGNTDQNETYLAINCFGSSVPHSIAN